MVADRFEEAYVPDIVPESDLAYFDAGGHGNRIGWGRSPAVLAVDFTETFTMERSEEGDRAVEATIVYTRPDRDLPEGYRGTTKPKAEATATRAVRNVIDDRLDPRDDEYVIDKPRASGFFDTHLAAILHEWDVDTVLVTGLTTSGCVRASVVDAHSNNFNAIVVEEGVADRSKISHEVSLFDMDMKYADVTPLAAVLDRLETHAVTA